MVKIVGCLCAKEKSTNHLQILYFIKLQSNHFLIYSCGIISLRFEFFRIFFCHNGFATMRHNNNVQMDLHWYIFVACEVFAFCTRLQRQQPWWWRWCCFVACVCARFLFIPLFISLFVVIFRWVADIERARERKENTKPTRYFRSIRAYTLLLKINNILQ